MRIRATELVLLIILGVVGFVVLKRVLAPGPLTGNPYGGTQAAQPKDALTSILSGLNDLYNGVKTAAKSNPSGS